MARPLPDRYLTPVDLADLLDVPAETVYPQDVCRWVADPREEASQ